MEEKIEELTVKALEDLGYDDCFIVDLKVNNTRVEVFLDSDTSVTFEICRKVSRHIEAVLDEKQWLGEKYTLEVSSAGVGRPLKFPRQYVKNIGRKIEVKTLDGDKVKGVLTAANEDEITVSFQETKKEGKKKIKVDVDQLIKLDNVKQSKIKVSL